MTTMVSHHVGPHPHPRRPTRANSNEHTHAPDTVVEFLLFHEANAVFSCLLLVTYLSLLHFFHVAKLIFANWAASFDTKTRFHHTFSCCIYGCFLFYFIFIFLHLLRFCYLHAFFSFFLYIFFHIPFSAFGTSFSCDLENLGSTPRLAGGGMRATTSAAWPIGTHAPGQWVQLDLPGSGVVGW